MKKIMIGVSTEQNTTNVIPALQMNIDEFVFIETSHANNNLWSDGANKVMHNHKIIMHKPIILKKEEDSRIDLIYKLVFDFLKSKPDFEIIWNLGGGQKAQQMALWQLFTNSTRMMFTDKACYTNPFSEELEIWQNINNQLNYSAQKVSSNLKAFEILEIFGFKTKGSELQLDSFVANEETVELWKIASFREYFYKVSAIKDIVGSAKIEKRQLGEYVRIENQAIQQYIKEEISSFIDNQSDTVSKNNLIHNFADILSKKIKEKILQIFWNETAEKHYFYNYTDDFKEKCIARNCKLPLEFNYNVFHAFSGEKKPADFFEKLLFNFIKLNFNTEIFVDCLFNVHTVEISSENPSAEYDVLIATRAGKLITIDAKTFAFEQKDADARSYNLSKAGGKYVEFIPLFPFDEYDWQQDYFPVALKNLIKRLSDIKTKFYVLSQNSDNKPEYTVDYNGSRIKMKSVSNFIK